MAQKPASQFPLRNCSGEAWFSAQFYILSEQRTINKATFLQGFKKIDCIQTACTIWPWFLERESHNQRSTIIGISGRGAFNFYF